MFTLLVATDIGLCYATKNPLLSIFISELQEQFEIKLKFIDFNTIIITIDTVQLCMEQT